jgi:hypothetical protein
MAKQYFVEDEKPQGVTPTKQYFVDDEVGPGGPNRVNASVGEPEVIDRVPEGGKLNTDLPPGVSEKPDNWAGRFLHYADGLSAIGKPLGAAVSAALTRQGQFRDEALGKGPGITKSFGEDYDYTKGLVDTELRESAERDPIGTGVVGGLGTLTQMAVPASQALGAARTVGLSPKIIAALKAAGIGGGQNAADTLARTGDPMEALKSGGVGAGMTALGSVSPLAATLAGVVMSGRNASTAENPHDKARALTELVASLGGAGVAARGWAKGRAPKALKAEAEQRLGRGFGEAEQSLNAEQAKDRSRIEGTVAEKARDKDFISSLTSSKEEANKVAVLKEIENLSKQRRQTEDDADASFIKSFQNSEQGSGPAQASVSPEDSAKGRMAAFKQDQQGFLRSHGDLGIGLTPDAASGKGRLIPPYADKHNAQLAELATPESEAALLKRFLEEAQASGGSQGPSHDTQVSYPDVEQMSAARKEAEFNDIERGQLTKDQITQKLQNKMEPSYLGERLQLPVPTPIDRAVMSGELSPYGGYKPIEQRIEENITSRAGGPVSDVKTTIDPAARTPPGKPSVAGYVPVSERRKTPRPGSDLLPTDPKGWQQPSQLGPVPSGPEFSVSDYVRRLVEQVPEGAEGRFAERVKDATPKGRGVAHGILSPIKTAKQALVGKNRAESIAMRKDPADVVAAMGGRVSRANALTDKGFGGGAAGGLAAIQDPETRKLVEYLLGLSDG